MSSFWKKLKNNGFKSEQLPQKSTSESNSSIHRQKNISTLISLADEKLYVNSSDILSRNEDPLLTKPQIIKNFDILLKQCFRLPYFLEFLRAHEVDHYSECWTECDKFRALTMSLLKRFINKEHNALPGNSSTSMKHFKISNRNTYNKKFSQKNQNVKAENVMPNMLPDLVSNIPNNFTETPVSSPEEVFLSPAETFNVATIVNNNDNVTLQQENRINENTHSKECLNEFLKQNDENANCDPSYDNTIKRLLYFASEIYNKYIDPNGIKSLDLPESVREVILDNIMSQNVDFGLFTHVQDYIYNFLQTDIWKQEEGQPLFEFWISAFNFREHLLRQQEKKTYNAGEAQSDAMVLYEKYFSLQATHKLGFSDEVRFIVECNICQESGPSPECFDVPLRIVHDVIQRDYLPGYISSTLHIKFVSELVNTMKISSFGRKKRTASGSTCLSEESTSTNKSFGKTSSISLSNTLLAMDSSGLRFGTGAGNKFLKNLDDPSLAMRIDSNQILDPDSLWRRKNFTKLSCGYVDELGRFESDLQPEPDRKEGSKLSRTLKRFVKFEESKVKEEMAYKVAEMIIKDVTSVTLGEQGTRSQNQRTRPLSLCVDEKQNKVRHSSSVNHLQRSTSEAFNLGSKSQVAGNVYL
ncbi:A-kinase anchor protein 10, mitochondrial [Armadillidium vulgare]|nr:A-kinase anchor protein 10, mitochondrial [Armadillidium vulgare]